MINARKIFGAFVIAIALFFFWPAVIGSWQEISALKGAVSERQDLLQQRQETFANVNTLYSDYKNQVSQQDSQKFSALVPVKKDSAELISAIQSIAGDSGITIKELRLADGKSNDSQFQTLSISLDLGGTYPALLTFLGELEKYVRLFNVRSLAISNNITQGGDSLSFTLKAEAYFLK